MSKVSKSRSSQISYHMHNSSLGKVTGFTVSDMKGKVTAAIGQETVAQVPVENKPSQQLANEQDFHNNMLRWATVAAANAFDATLQAGLPVTIVENDQIVRVFPDGHKEVIGPAD